MRLPALSLDSRADTTGGEIGTLSHDARSPLIDDTSCCERFLGNRRCSGRGGVEEQGLSCAVGGTIAILCGTELELKRRLSRICSAVPST